MSSEHPIITYASFQTTMPVITIAARISTTPPIAPPTSAAMFTEGCATEVEEHICLLKRLCSGMNQSLSGLNWSQVVWNEAKWYGMSSSGMD